MPLVEVLPNSSSAVAPGWTYVVDRGYDPSKVAFNPKDRKRVAARPGGPRREGELSARQQAAIAQRIAELGRDNDAKQVIAIPWKGAAAKTQNARRILQFQRQIKHWLDDEEALAAQQAAIVPGPRSAAATQLRRQSTRPSISVPPTPSGAATPVPPGPAPNTVSALDDPILSVQKDMPAPLDPAELEALLSAPPMLYGASLAAPPALGGPPQRKFCDNCGYWGKIKCLKCGARACGLECKDAHEATRCLKWA